MTQFNRSKCRIWLCAGVLVLGCAFCGDGYGQIQTTSGLTAAPASVATASTATPRYLHDVGVPFEARDFSQALANVFDAAGHARRILTGVITHGSSDTPFVFTRELDQKVRLDFGAPLGASLSVTLLNTMQSAIPVMSGNALADWQYDAAELLADDSVEGFVFSFVTTARFVWMGANYRITEHSGSGFDVFRKMSNVGVQPGAPQRNKVYLFDNKTRLLAYTRYEVERNGAPVSVEIEFADWSQMNGQTVPTKMRRLENGQVVLTVSILSAATAPTQLDHLFGDGN